MLLRGRRPEASAQLAQVLEQATPAAKRRM